MTRFALIALASHLLLLIGFGDATAQVFEHGQWNGYLMSEEDGGGCRMSIHAGGGLHLTAQTSGSGDFILGVVNTEWDLGEKENDSAFGSMSFDGGEQIDAYAEFAGSKLILFSPIMSTMNLRGLLSNSKYAEVAALGTRFRISLDGSSRAVELLTSCAIKSACMDVEANSQYELLCQDSLSGALSGTDIPDDPIDSASLGRSMTVDETFWKGVSNDHGGIVTYGYHLRPGEADFSFEMTESEWLEVRCDGFDGRATIRFGANIADDDSDEHSVIFDVDGVKYTRTGPLDEGGLFPGSPIATLNRGDELLEALMAGSNLQVHVGMEKKFPLLDLSLTGTRQQFSEHLANCVQ